MFLRDLAGRLERGRSTIGGRRSHGGDAMKIAKKCGKTEKSCKHIDYIDAYIISFNYRMSGRSESLRATPEFAPILEEFREIPRASSSKYSKIWYELTKGPVDSCRSDSSEYVLERGETDGGEEVRDTRRRAARRRPRPPRRPPPRRRPRRRRPRRSRLPRSRPCPAQARPSRPSPRRRRRSSCPTPRPGCWARSSRPGEAGYAAGKGEGKVLESLLKKKLVKRGQEGGRRGPLPGDQGRSEARPGPGRAPASPRRPRRPRRRPRPAARRPDVPIDVPMPRDSPRMAVPGRCPSCRSHP